jgi:hypothetical protein
VGKSKREWKANNRKKNNDIFMQAILITYKIICATETYKTETQTGNIQ